MKRTLLAAALLGVFGVASAAPSLSWTELSQDNMAPVNLVTHDGFDPNSLLTYGGTAETGFSAAKISIGQLSGSEHAYVTYTYLGYDAGYRNLFYSASPYTPLSAEFVTRAPDATSIGASFTVEANAGLLGFGFEGLSPNQALNNSSSTWAAGTSIGLIGRGVTFGANTFDYVLGYNDSYHHADWDDLVIGVNIAPIPEPETYAMLLAGLGLMGFVARRRKKAATI
jgi:hypothetical protein